MIVTKDADFSEFGVMKGFPPKIIWIRRGNCSTKDIEMIKNWEKHQVLASECEEVFLTCHYCFNQTQPILNKNHDILCWDIHRRIDVYLLPLRYVRTKSE